MRHYVCNYPLDLLIELHRLIFLRNHRGLFCGIYKGVNGSRGKFKVKFVCIQYDKWAKQWLCFAANSTNRLRRIDEKTRADPHEIENSTNFGHKLLIPTQLTRRIIKSLFSISKCINSYRRTRYLHQIANNISDVKQQTSIYALLSTISNVPVTFCVDICFVK